MNGTYYISAERMTVGYDGKPLIENISIGVRRGEILTLIGPNGSGKSTILKSMIKQLRLIAGTVVLDGKDMAGLRERDIAKKLAIVMTDRIRGELMTCRDIAATGRRRNERGERHAQFGAGLLRLDHRGPLAR